MTYYLHRWIVKTLDNPPVFGIISLNQFVCKGGTEMKKKRILLSLVLVTAVLAAAAAASAEAAALAAAAVAAADAAEV